MLGGLCNLLAGIGLFVLAKHCRAQRPSVLEVRNAALVGTLLEGLSSGMLSYGMRTVGTGTAAVMVATYQLIATLPGSKTPVYTSASFDLVNNADWLITTLPAANVLQAVVTNKIRVLVAQGGNTQQPARKLPDTLQ